MSEENAVGYWEMYKFLDDAERLITSLGNLSKAKERYLDDVLEWAYEQTCAKLSWDNELGLVLQIYGPEIKDGRDVVWHKIDLTHIARCADDVSYGAQRYGIPQQQAANAVRQLANALLDQADRIEKQQGEV